MSGVSIASRACLSALAVALALPAAAAAQAPLAAAQALQWRLVGPFRGGRTRAVTGIPGQPGTFLIGAVNGGVWKTTDYGRTWNPVFDSAATQSIGAIAVAPSDPSIIYVASGEGLARPDLSVGNGVYRSSDAGLNWSHLALDDAQQIPDLAVDPRDPNRLYAAVLGHPYGANAQRGIFRSQDGGKSWTRVLHTDGDTGGSCIKIDPHDPNVLYAALWSVRSGPWEDKNVFNGSSGGLYKSSDGGDHWRRLTQGLPENLAQIEVAVSPSQPGRLYATVATTAEGDYSSAAGLGVYRSNDGGETWVRATSDPRPALRIGGGDLPIIKVDPRNADVLYSASLVTVKSTDGGAHWSSLRGSPGGDDYQNLWISPDDSRHIALVSDQGAIITVNGGATWSSWLNQPTAQLYHIGVTDTFPYRICSGQQESGSVCIATRGNDGEITFRDWHPVGVIEYGYAVPDPLDPDLVYGSGRNVVTKTRLSTGQVQDITPIPLKGAGVRVDRTEPLLFSPQDPHRMYYAANRLYETIDGGQHWRVISPDLARDNPGAPPSVGGLHLPKAELQRGVIYAASASALADGLIWTGTDDGLVWVTRDGGKEWQNVTPPALTPWSKVTQIEASHFDPEVAYVSVSRFRVDDLRPYVYRTRDGGRTWSPITVGLPDDAPVNTVREDLIRRGLLFAGTERSVWVSYDDGDHWNSLQLNLPHTSMRDLAIHGFDLIVATHGRSFWVLDDISPLRQFTAPAAAREAALLKPAPAVRVKRSTGSDTPIQPDEPAGRNPPDGAVIDYYLARDASRTLTIEILDSSGTVVRRASSADPPPFTPARLERELIPAYWIRMTPPLSASAGMHRWVWDLHYAPPRSAKHTFPISAVPGDTPQEPLGPPANPGTYRVRLSVGPHQWEQPLSVSADPRVKLAPEDFSAQFDLARRLAAALDGSTGALLEARSIRAQLTDLSARADAGLAQRIRSLDPHIAALLESADDGVAPRRGLERLNGDFLSLYTQVTDADAAPTAAQVSDSELALKDWNRLETGWRSLRDGEAGELDRELLKARLPRLRFDVEPPRNPEFADAE
ncbi:MAG: WD40/YVTN/BNR-like repeat-containing protein [Steroidobacteraceae bacterium]